MVMENVLDNPVWNALISGNRRLATGSERVKLFDPAVSPFVALIENTRQNFMELSEMVNSDQLVFLWAKEILAIPKVWNVLHCIPGFQMVYEKAIVQAYKTDGITALTDRDIPDMLALTKLTKPGPFGMRTIEFGNYEGIFENAQLVAMTGQRFHPFDHIEISAVCTHPDYLGRGYARQLLLSQLSQILDAGSKPHLHVRIDNERAIHVYRALGFTVRIPVYFYIIKKLP